MPNDIPNSTWNEADASNTAPVPNGAPEGWFPSDVNNVYRMGMGATKRFWDHINFTETTTGTSTAYVLSYDVAPQQLWDGEIYSFIVGTTCGAAPTLNVNALGAKNLRKFVGTAWANIGASELKALDKVVCAYNSADDKFDVLARASLADAPSLAGDNAFTGENSFADTVTMVGAALNFATRVTMASASSMAIGAAASNWLRFTGTATINGFDTVASGIERDVLFADAMTLVDGANLHLQNDGSNIVTEDGDTAKFWSAGSGVWYMSGYQRANGQALKTKLTTASATLGSNVDLDNTSNYFTGPTISNPGPGTYLVIGHVTVYDSTSGNAQIYVRLTDGTTTIASGVATPNAAGAAQRSTVELSGVITNPAGAPRVQARDVTTVNGQILSNVTGNGKDSTITWIRIA